MKRTPILLVLSAMLLSPLFADQAKPELSIVDAAKAASDYLEEQNLPEDNFIRSLTLIQRPANGGFAYEARFEPMVVRRIRVNTEPEPIIRKVIVVSMDGTASIEERKDDSSQRIISRPITITPSSDQ